MRILIVETDLALAYKAIATLEAEGHEVFGPAGNVREALQWAACEKLDLALVNIHFDGEDGGIALARELRNEHSVSSIFVSDQGSVALEDQEAALGLLRKPYEAAELVDSTLVAQCLMTGGWPPPRPVPSSMEIFRTVGA